MVEALEAFKTKYGELPADAGYPVVREMGKDIYFTHSVDDWVNYTVAYYRFYGLVKVVIFSIIAAVVASVCVCWYTASFTPFLWALAPYAVFLLLMYLVSLMLFKRKKNGEGELINYSGCRKKFYVIEL